MNIQPRTMEFRRPAAAAVSQEEATIFPPAIYTNATYSRGILIPNIPTNGAVVDGNNMEQVSVEIPSGYFTSSSHSLPCLTSQEAANWNHNIAAHASSRRRPPFEIGRLLGTITLYFDDTTKKKSESLHFLATKYYGKYAIQSRKCGKKEGDKFKALTSKQALVEAMTEAGLEEDTIITTLSPERQNALQTRSHQIFDYWKRIRDSPALHECWHKRDGGFIPQSLGRVITKDVNDEFYVPIATLLQWLDHEDVRDLAADRAKSLYGGLRHVNTDATSILESLLDLSCPSSLYKIPLITPYAVAARSVANDKVTWKVRIGVYMNRLLPEILTQKNLHIIMSALDEGSYIVSQPLHLPPMRDSNDPVFASAKYPIVQMPEEELDDAMNEDKKEDTDYAMLGSTRDTKTISPFTPRGLLKLLENTGNVTSGFPEIARALAPYLKLDLMLHQQHAICWMRQMEQLPGFGINSIIWEEREFLDGNKYYYSPALGQIRLNRPPVTAGGCVADEMGLGKTIQMLSLIACSLEELKTEARASEDHRSTHATLIVLPPALVAQWVAEVSKCCGDTLSVNFLDVNDKDFLTRDLVDAGGNGNDILVTTYSSLDNIKTSRYLASWKWGRIVLDEQQEIRSSTTEIAKNCESLDCHRRWMLSGTPIFEGIQDLRGELNFLRLTPYAARWEDGFFDFSIMNHWNHHSEHGIETLRILGLLILRRSKDMTICCGGMPIMSQKKLTVELVPVAQSDSERALYCWFEYLVSQEISRKYGDEKSSKHNLQSRDLCLRLLREICFSAVLINGGLGAGSQMRNLNGMYRRLLLREVEDEDKDQRKNKKPGVIKVLSPIEALSYLSQAERAANVGTDFVSEQTFAGGQGASSRTYAVDSIEDQIEVITERVNEGRKKEADARQKRAKANWHLALERITAGAFNNDKEVLIRVSPKISSLWKWRDSCEGETIGGWRPTSRLVQDLQKKFAWANPTALRLVNIPSQVTSDELSTALLDSAREELKIQARLARLNTSLSNAKKEDAKARIQQEISETEALLAQAIADDKQLQTPIVTAVNVFNDDKWIAYVNVTDEKLLEQLMRQARSKVGIVIKSKRPIPYIQEAINNATEKMKQAEAAFTVHPSRKNREDKVKARKELDNVRNGLSIKFDSNFVPSTLHVTMSQAVRSRGRTKSKTALCESASASIALANETLELVLPRLKNDSSTLGRLQRILEKKGDQTNYLAQKSAFDTLESLRRKDFDDTFCPICQLAFGENASDDPNVENPLAAMISCGHFFCIKCIDQHIQNEIRHFRALTCPCCRKGFNQTNDVIHIDHLATDHEEIAVRKADAKRKVIEASSLLASSDGVLEGELWKHLFWSIDMPTHVSDAPHRQHTALPRDVLAHFRAATGMQIDCPRPVTPVSWTSKDSKDDRDNSGLSSKIQTLLRDLPLGERAVVFSNSKEGVLHLTTVIKACGIDCFSLYVGAANNATECWSSLTLDPTKPGAVLVVQAGAAASGLTLTAASKIFLMEPFNRQEEEHQAYARCHRYGQTQDVHVKVYYAPVSVESRLLRWRKRSAQKFAPASNGPNYVFTKLYEDSGEGDDETSSNSVSLGGEGSDDESTENDLNGKENAENHEENLRTQFLLGLVDEHGNPVGSENEGIQHVVERPISGRRFVLG